MFPGTVVPFVTTCFVTFVAEGRISGQYKIALLEMAKDRLEAKDDAGAEELLKKAPWKRRDVR